MTPAPVVTILDDPEALARAAAEQFVRSAAVAVQRSGRFSVALAGGSTPRRLYELLAEDGAFRNGVRWEAVHLFWGDERHVPPDHLDSNYRMAYDAMIARLRIPDANVHRIRCELPDPQEIAAGYESELRSFFGEPPGRVPRFDLILLGLGADGHTASLFPGTAAVHERVRLVVPNIPPGSDRARITMTPVVLNQASEVQFLVSGPEKARALAAVLRGPSDVDRWPAQAVSPSVGNIVWLLDRDAARLLKAES
jgi:6-phosphogluconolactonase